MWGKLGAQRMGWTIVLLWLLFAIEEISGLSIDWAEKWGSCMKSHNKQQTLVKYPESIKRLCLNIHLCQTDIKGQNYVNGAPSKKKSTVTLGFTATGIAMHAKESYYKCT